MALLLLVVVFFQWSRNPNMPDQSVPDSPEQASPSKNKQSSPSKGVSGKPELKFEDNLKELGKYFFYFVVNYFRFELMEYYIKPYEPVEMSRFIPLEK